tara:strand:+ start:3288 stop:4544 length:1257 start_codon:yes stop_codon:yes gene_type:complete
MAVPTLSPKNTTSEVVLTSTGSTSDVAAALPYGIYSANANFISGAVDQVAYTFKKLGGDVLDIELTNGNVYAAYEESVLEYSYLVNIHQAKNSLGDMLGNTTASFDQDGEISSGQSLSGSNIQLKYPRFTFQYSQRVGEGIASEANVGGNLTVYSASFATTSSVQDYDLQKIISSSFTGLDSGDTIKNRGITIRDVYYTTRRAQWRFYAFYGGLNVIGNMSTYGQYADDSTFEVIPTWQNKLQAINYEDSIKTRISNYSYEIHNNKLRLYPIPSGLSDETMWVRFTVHKDSWDETSDRRRGVDGVNNMNTLPFANIPYNNINSIGKQWIRRFALSICKEMLGQVRSKFGGTIPIPGESLNLNGSDLITQARDEQEKLRDELKTVLDELTYAKLAERDATIAETVAKTQTFVPLPIFVG